MANCVNTNTKEFKELSAEAKLNPIVLAAKVSLWQEVNGLDNFPSLRNLKITEFNSVKGFHVASRCGAGMPRCSYARRVAMRPRVVRAR